MTRTRWIGLVVLVLLANAIAVRLGWFADPIPKLAGTAVWTTARAAGVTAFAALTLDVVFGLFVSTGVLDRWVPRGASVDVHRWLSSVALTLVGVHVLALLGDASVQFDALDVLIPGLSTYRPGAVALGVFAMYGALVVDLSFGWRKRIGVRAWRALHFTAFAVFVAAVVHGLLAGTDAAHHGLRTLYASAAAVVIGLVVIRIGAVFVRGARLTPSRAR
ncbi:MAG: ferric reductase-like transmembrane domain-containing protein [Myxococcales bacterium]|nr:ferric reductase-like transmembrane domain-containing protein [Myxococcales bacterium]